MRKIYNKILIILLLAVTFLTITWYVEISSSFHNSMRRLSINLGNGTCEWTPPIYDVPVNETFKKTAIVGYPSGDKRLTFVQMEALTGLSARDEWDFAFLGMTNQPFIKANYPHHEGIWGWKQEADEIVMVVRNLRRSLVEYHDILWDIGYAKTFEEAFKLIPNLYQERPPLEDFLVWRDKRVMEEVNWYGWFIDYWMEGGLMRDMFTKKITTPKHWYMLMMPTVYTVAELNYDLVVGKDTIVSPSYDPHCLHDVSGGCHPVQIISGEKLVDHTTGPQEGRKIAEVLKGNEGVDSYLIEEEAWECIWEELILRRRGLKTFIDREGLEERDYNFSEEMLEQMVKELDYLINKYGAPEWNWRQTARDLVALLEEHRVLITDELNDVRSGVRKLSRFDFHGPKSRLEQRYKDTGIKPSESTYDFSALEAEANDRRKNMFTKFMTSH